MQVKIGLRLDPAADSKLRLVQTLISDLNMFIADNDYGNGILEYFIALQIVNPPDGYEHLFREFKPKFIEYKSMTNRFTGEPFVINKQYSCSIKLVGEKFLRFASLDDNESEKILSLEILNSLSGLDKVSKKIMNFNYEKFKTDMNDFLDKNH